MGAAFDVLRGTTTIAASGTTVTITESTDYTLPTGAALTNCFIKVCNTRMWGMGDTAGGGTQAARDYAIRITNPGNLLTSITFERDRAASFACRVTWEILCYIGAGSGSNEFVVRDEGTLMGTNVSTLSTANVSGVVDNADVAVLITSQSCATNSSSDVHAMLWTGAWNTVGPVGDFTRLGGAAAGVQDQWVSYAIVEFVGSNWTVDRFETGTTGTTWSTSDNNNFTVAHSITISDLAKAGILQTQYKTSNDGTGLDDIDSLILDSTTNLRIWNRATAGTRTKVVWILQNSQASGSARNFKCQHLEYRDDTITGSEERVFTKNFSTDPTVGSGSSLVAPLAETTVSGSCGIDGTGTAFPRGSIDMRITAADQITFTESDVGQERRLAIEIMEWPEDEVGGGGRIMSSLANAGGLAHAGGIAGQGGGLAG